jgi:hypothetical protein
MPQPFHCRLLIAGWLGAALSLNAAISISTDFESGSARVLALDSETQQVRISPAGDPKRGTPNWWYLRVDGIDTHKPLTLEVVARVEAVPAHPGQPLAAAWALPNRAAISTNGMVWEQTAAGERDGATCVYRLPAGPATVWLAWGPPFTPRDAATFADRIAQKYSFAKRFTLARSREGRDIPALQICEGDKPASNRPAVWIQARQHAWECGGSWVAVGLADWLTGNDEHAQWLRRNAEVFVVPLMDVDQVASGDGGKLALPQDQNLDWSDAPYWPEVAAAQKRILALTKENRMAIYLDLHNPSAGQQFEAFYLPYPPMISEETARLQERFLGGVRSLFGEIVLHDVAPQTPAERASWRPGAGKWLRDHCGPRTISFVAETPWNTPQGTTEGYAEVGRKLARAVEKYLRETPKEDVSPPGR